MNRGFLALGAALLLAGVVGLYVALRPDGDPDRSSAPAPAAANPAHPDARPARAAHVPVPPPRPAGSEAGSEVAGEVRVRDHRSATHGSDEPPPVPPPSHPPDERRVNVSITSDLSHKIHPALRQCTENVAAGAHSDRSRIEGQIVIAIRDGHATVTGADFQLRDVAEAAQAELKQCLSQRVVGLEAPASGEADLDSYAITLSLAWP